jgi:hypothetical protein
MGMVWWLSKLPAKGKIAIADVTLGIFGVVLLKPDK